MSTTFGDIAPCRQSYTDMSTSSQQPTAKTSRTDAELATLTSAQLNVSDKGKRPASAPPAPEPDLAPEVEMSDANNKEAVPWKAPMKIA